MLKMVSILCLLVWLCGYVHVCLLAFFVLFWAGGWGGILLCFGLLCFALFCFGFALFWCVFSLICLGFAFLCLPACSCLCPRMFAGAGMFTFVS